MKKSIRSYARICYALLLLSTKSLAQQTFTISPEESRQITKYARNCPIYPVSRKTVETENRQALFLDGKAIDPNTISGSFTKLADDYVLVRYDVKGMFLKNELVTDIRGQYNQGYDKHYSVIENTDTKQLYYIECIEYLPAVDAIVERRPILQALKKSGYEQYEKDGEMYIKSKTAEIKLDTWTFSELKHDPSYIIKFDNDQTKIATLVKQTASHSKTLDKYINLYNIKRSKMPSVDIKAWRTATTNAQKMQDQIYKLEKKYQGNYSFKLFNSSDAYEVFLNNLRASKGVLGM